MEKRIRNANVEILRIIAMLMVITLHVSNKGMGEMTLWSGPYFLKWIMNGFCFCAVDIFFFISAYYLYDRKFQWSRIIRLWLEVLFYAVGILLVCNICQIVPFNITLLVKACVPIAFHEYGFVTGYFGMCFMAPTMTMILERLNQREHAVLIIILLFLASIYPMCTGWQIIFFKESNLFGLALLIFCIAAYVRRYGIRYGGKTIYTLLFSNCPAGAAYGTWN